MRIQVWLSITVRVLFGALFVVSGANKVVPLFPPPTLPDAGASFVVALVATGYFLPLLGLIEVASGALLISGQFVPLALVVLAPIVVNIALFHAFLVPSVPSIVLVVGGELFLAWQYRNAFSALLQRQSSHPRVASARAN